MNKVEPRKMSSFDGVLLELTSFADVLLKLFDMNM